MKSSKRVWITVLICASLFFFMPRGSMAAETLPIGVSLGLSGPGGPWGVSILKGWQLHAKQINDAGGLKVGDKRYMMKLIEGDDLYTAAGGRSVAEKLIFRDKVKFVFGPLSSAAAAAAVPTYEKNGVLSIPMCATYSFFGPKTPLCFKFHMTTSLVAYNSPEFIARNFPNVKNMAYQYVNDETGIEILKFFNEGMKRLEAMQPGRLKVSEPIATELKTPDWAPVVTKILAQKPDLIFTAAVGSEGALFIKACREQGYTKVIFSPSSLDSSLVRKIAGPDFAYDIWHFGLDWEHPFTPELKQYADQFLAAYKELPLDCQVWSVDHVPIFSRAVERAQSVDPKAVAQALESMKDIPTMFGKAAWGGEKQWGLNHQLLKPQLINEIVKGGKNETKGMLEIKMVQ